MVCNWLFNYFNCFRTSWKNWLTLNLIKMSNWQRSKWHAVENSSGCTNDSLKMTSVSENCCGLIKIVRSFRIYKTLHMIQHFKLRGLNNDALQLKTYCHPPRVYKLTLRKIPPPQVYNLTLRRMWNTSPPPPPSIQINTLQNECPLIAVAF